jgi:tetratricopeptide (TPR) repeat protein
MATCILQLQAAVGQVTVGFEEPHNAIVMSIPNDSPALQIDLLHLRLEQNQLDQTATRRRVMASDVRGWVFTAFVYPLDKKQTATELSEEQFVAEQKKFKIEGLKTSTRGGFVIRDYMIPDFRGQKLNQKNVFGYATVGDVGMDFHISKIPYSPADDAFFDSLFTGLHVLQDYKPDATTEFGYGSIFYLREDWSKARVHYEKALELEKQKRTLSPVQWNVLVDNLGMAYGMSGEFPKAKAVLEYGAHENPTYPMFHYNIACADAELGDLEGALEQLKVAFQYKSHSNPGEGIPDPSKDDSFKRYLNDIRFAQLTRELCPTSKQTQGGWSCE